jgi:hypothetical protein
MVAVVVVELMQTQISSDTWMVQVHPQHEQKYQLLVVGKVVQVVVAEEAPMDTPAQDVVCMQMQLREHRIQVAVVAVLTPKILVLERVALELLF